MLFRSAFFMSLDISFWKGCDRSVKLVAGAGRWTTGNIINSSQKEKRVEETMCEAKQPTSSPYCRVNSGRPLYLRAFTPVRSGNGAIRCFPSIWAVVTSLIPPLETQPLLAARALLFSDNLCRHPRCSLSILQDSWLTRGRLLASGGQCHLYLLSCST